MIEAGNCRVDGHPDVDGSTTAESMFPSESRLEHLVRVELQQLKVSQQQSCYRDLSIVERL